MTSHSSTTHVLISPRHIRTKDTTDAAVAAAAAGDFSNSSSSSYVDLSHCKWVKLSEVHQVDGVALPHSDVHDKIKNAHHIIS